MILDMILMELILQDKQKKNLDFHTVERCEGIHSVAFTKDVTSKRRFGSVKRKDEGMQ